VSGAGFLPRIVLLVAALMMLSSGSALAEEPDAGAVAGSYTIDDATPTPLADSDPATCWSVRSGDAMTVDAPAADRLLVTIPSTGRSWRLQPMPPLSDDPFPGATSKWIGSDDDLASKGQGSVVEFYAGDSRRIRAKLQYGMHGIALTGAGCEIIVSAYSRDGTDREPAAPSGQQLGVSLGCQHDFGDSRRVECTATPTQPADAYDWTFDGTPQTAATGPELQMSDVPPGSHTVSVVARDTVNGLTSSPDSLTFTKSAGGSGGGLPSVPSIPLVPLLIGGVALVGGAALVGRKLWPKAVAGVPVPATRPLGAPMPAGMPRPPGAPPESLGAPTIPPWPQEPPQGAAAPPAAPLARPLRPAEALRSGAAPPARRPARKQPVPPAATPPRQQRSTKNFRLEVTPSPIPLRGDGRDLKVVYVRAFRTVDGAVTNVSGEVPVVNVQAWNEKKITLGEPPPSSGIGQPPFVRAFAVRARHIGPIKFQETLTFDATSVRGEHARERAQVVVEPSTWEVQVKAHKKGFENATVTDELRHTCANFHGSVESTGFKEFRAFNQPIGDGPVEHAKVTVAMRVDTGEWMPLGETDTGPTGTFRVEVPQKVRSQFGTEFLDEELSVKVKLLAGKEVREAVGGYITALKDLLADLGLPGPDPYLDVIEDCKGYPAKFLEQLRTEKEERQDSLLGAVHLLRASVLFLRCHRRDFRQQRVMLNMASKDVFERFFDVFTDFLPIAGWLLGDKLELPLVSKVLARFGFRDSAAPPLEFMSLPDLARAVADKMREMWFGGAIVKFVLTSVELLVAAPLRGLAKVAVTLFKYLFDWATEFGLKADALGRFLSNFERELEKPSPGGAGGIVDVVVGIGHLFVAFVTWVVSGLLWIFVTVIAFVLKQIAKLGEAAFREQFAGTKATWAEQLEEKLGDWAKNAYDAVGSIVEGLLAKVGLSDSKDAAAVKARSGRDLNEVFMDLVASLDDMDKLGAPALKEAYRNSLQVQVAQDWRTRLKQAIDNESSMQNWWQEFYTNKDGDYGFVQWADSVDRWSKVAVRVVQGICFGAAALQSALAKLFAEAATEAAFKGNRDAAAVLDLKSQDHATTAKARTDFAGMFETLADVLTLIFTKGLIFGLELGHLFYIVIKSPRRVEELYRQ